MIGPGTCSEAAGLCDVSGTDCMVDTDCPAGETCVDGTPGACYINDDCAPTPISVPGVSPVEAAPSAATSAARTLTVLPAKPALAHARPTAVYRDSAASLSVTVDPWHPTIPTPVSTAAYPAMTKTTRAA